VRRKTPVAQWLALLLAAAVVLVGGVYTFLPPLVEGMVARSVQDRLGLQVTPDVELESAAPPEILTGRFSGGRISLESADLGGVWAEQVFVDLDPFDLDVLGSLIAGAPRSEKPLSGTLRVELSEEEVLRVVETRADVPVRKLELEEGQMLVQAETSGLGVEAPVSVRGAVTLQGESLIFEPQRVSVLGAPVPGWVTERLLAQTELAYPLGRLPYGAEISGVEVAENRLILSGEVECIPTNQSIG
jgi:hypothetical protein